MSQIDSFSAHLEEGDLYGFEERLYVGLKNCYNESAKEALRELSCSNEVLGSQRKLAADLGLGKLKLRPVKIQLRTGCWVEVKSLYAKRVPVGWSGQRQLLCVWWSVLEGASPAFYNLVCLYSVLCCSYDVARQVLQLNHVRVGFERMRLLANRISALCIGHRPELVLGKGETLKGKRVFISVDGGRARTRCYLSEKNKAGTHHKFSTPWKEPKMLVISLIDETGKIERGCLPVYDCSFGDDEIIALLRQYLSALQVHEAELVQIVADGAPWIWNRMRPMLEALGVVPHKIVETVDYYHAVQNLQKVSDLIPEKKQETLAQLKEHLWNGKIEDILKVFQKQCPNWNQQMLDALLGYFSKNADRMQYQEYRKQNLPCGSGTMESAVRRVICLRFKCPSAFWNLDNLEGLIFLRSVLLAKRWGIFIGNLARCP